MRTYAVWELIDNVNSPELKVNAEYHQALARAMNHGYESYRNGRISLLIFSRIYDSTLRQNSRDLLVEALEGNPHMMDVWMKLIHDITGSDALPIESDNVFTRIPKRCPSNFDRSLRNRLKLIVDEHLSNYMQLYIEVLLRLIAPPSCCSFDEPYHLETLRSAWSKEERELVKEYLYDGYVSCASKSASILEIIEIIQDKILLEGKSLELDVLSELLQIVISIATTRDDASEEKNKNLLINFFTVCDVFPRFHVTASAWAIATHHRACAEARREFLFRLADQSLLENSVSQWNQLQNTSAKSTDTWNEYYLKGWLSGRTGDIIPLLVGVKESIDGGLIRTIKGRLQLYF